MDHSDEAAFAAADEMFAKRGCCCIWVPWPGTGTQKAWERIRTHGSEPTSGRPWWSRGVKAFRKVREWSEVVAGPRWKTFIRRFRRRSKHSGGRTGGKFGYDPLSYARNFDGGQSCETEDDAVLRGFSARFATPPASAKSSMDLGGRDAPMLFVEDAHH
ncbi:hypothetical protein Cni_G03834 [Canna indica]|uniref:Uncharacterized protein n=1 Tax=Canna indica TaxID=4628 RepID=A0AAQ3JSA2_9LILI|nr:hypothetical protein Cni_G03834 [Canna indica]